jgi:hypothetical protein
MVFGMTNQSFISQILIFAIWGLLFIFLNKFLYFKALVSMEEVVETLEGYTKESVKLVKWVAKKKGGTKKDPTSQIERIMEFFFIPPVSLDPYGILNKLEYLIDRAEDRFEYVVSEIAPEADKVWKANLNSLLKGTVGLNMLTKILRHFLESAKKTKNIFVAMPILIQLPLIKKVGKAQMEGVKAISKGKPIGDGIGPLVTSNLIQTKETETAAKDVVYSQTTLKNRKVHILKADGPGATLGKLGNAVKKIASENKVKKIITIDASLKLEGEETGKVSEGVGAAIGDPGPEKSKMEETAIELGIPIEAVVIKMSIEEAISPLTKNIASSVEKVLELIEDSVGIMGANDEALIVGVGNTCGIGNSKEEVLGLKFPKPKIEEEKISRLDGLIKKLATPPKPSHEKKKSRKALQKKSK